MMNDLAIECRGVCKRYRHFSLDNVDLQLPKGQVMGLIGPNGAGKSTTLRILLGLVHQDAGSVTVMGQAMPRAQVAAKSTVGFASEDMRLYGHATLGWHMDFMASIYPTWDAGYARDLHKRFGLVPKQKIKGLSHGQRVKALLLLVLARRPQLLVLDEPTTGLDPVARYDLLTELAEILADEERTILFSSHNTLDVEQLSDTITFIDHGRIIASDDKEHFLDRWRRLHVELPPDGREPQLPGAVGRSGDGRLVVYTVNQFDGQTMDRCIGAGANVHKVVSMTLEEIFVATIKHKREAA